MTTVVEFLNLKMHLFAINNSAVKGFHSNAEIHCFNFRQTSIRKFHLNIEQGDK